MAATITQNKAKVLIRDYLRETGRRGVTSLMRDINRHTRTEVFAQRTLEKWLTEPDRMLQDENWALVLSFVESEQFKRFVPYANEGSAERRLIQVADGLAALYSQPKNPAAAVIVLPSKVKADGEQAVQLLSGNWENVANLADRDVPRTLCKIAHVPGKPYAKFAYVALFRSRQVSATGVVIYLDSVERAEYDYLHRFILQVWRRRDPETGSTMPGDLGHRKEARRQPEFAVSNEVNRYFYKSEGEPSDERVVLLRARDVIPEEDQVIDSLLEDVLPHGYRET